MKRRTSRLLAPLLAVVALSGTAVAQDSGGASQPTGGQTRDGVLNIDAFVIQGNVEKPQIQYIISREKIRDVTPLDLKESFLHKIVKAVEKEPF